MCFTRRTEYSIMSSSMMKNVSTYSIKGHISLRIGIIGFTWFEGVLSDKPEQYFIKSPINIILSAM